MDEIPKLKQGETHHRWLTAIKDQALDSVRKLVVPKVIACTLMLPLLTSIACFIGIFGGLIIAVGSTSNDFGIPGVAEHCLYLDSYQQADR